MYVNRVKLIAEMASQKIKVYELAEKAGISRMTITAMRCGKSCSKKSIDFVAQALGVDPLEIMEQEE